MNAVGLPLRDAILRAAIAAFVDDGYEATSMDVIAARAGTTKRTVYTHFGSKELLFRAAVTRAIELFHGKLPTLDIEGDLAEQLEAFAARLCELCTWDRSVNLQRLAMGEAKRFPDLSRLLHRDIIDRTQATVAEHLLSVAARKNPGAEPRSLAWALWMASLFVNMTTGAQRFATLLQNEEPIPRPPGSETSPDVNVERIKLAVQMFVHGFITELRPDCAATISPDAIN
jgi:AcrR family transcriptional regulator